MATVVSIIHGDRDAVLRRRDELAESHLDLVPPIARAILASLPPSFELDDLLGQGNSGLLKAATNYDPRRHNGTPFSAYARPVIRGAILDSVKRGKYHENPRPPLSEMPEPAAVPDPESELDSDRRRLALARALETLGDRHRAVIDWRYSDDLRFPVVGELLGVGKARASQLHMEAVRALRSELVGV